MVSHLFFYQLVLIALVWLCLMLHWVWPSDPAAACPPTPEPPPPRPKRQREPKPFAGLTTKPPCDACEHATAPRPQAPAAPPPASCPRGGAAARSTPPPISARTRTVPIAAGWAGAISAPMAIPVAVPGGSCCVSSVVGYFLETLGTIFHGKRVSVDLIVRVIACLAEGLGIRGTARVFEVDPNTVLQWLVEAAEQLRAFSQHFLHDVRVQQVQLDELFALLSAVKDGEVSEAEAIERLERRPSGSGSRWTPRASCCWRSTSGDRTLAMAQRVVHHVAQVLAPDCAPLFLTDGFREYLTALLTHYGQWVQPATPPGHRPSAQAALDAAAPAALCASGQDRAAPASGRRAAPRGVWHPGGRQSGAGPLGWQINTAFVERINLTIRQHVAAVGRRVSTLCKGEDGLRQQLAVYPLLLQFLLAPCQLTPALAAARAHQRHAARPRSGSRGRPRWRRG